MIVSLLVKRILLVVLLVWVSTGCYVPISRTTPGHREYFTASREDFTLGETTRAEVLLKMGEPDEKSQDDTLLIYRWSEDQGVIVITSCVGGVLSETTSIKLMFDTDGILKSLDIGIEE